MTKFQINNTTIHFSNGFLLLLSWFNFLDTQNILPQILLACLLHELAHIFTITKCKGKILHIIFTVVGAEIQVKDKFSKFTYQQEFLCAISGAALNLILSLLFSFFPQTRLFSGINLALALLNLLPISKLDGGQALHCLFSLLFPVKDIHLLEKSLDILLSILLLALGFWIFLEGGTVTLFLLGFWLLQSTQTNTTQEL